jgi:hypothetical protein
MRSVRSLILIGTIAALAALPPLASASTAKPFHAVKDCVGTTDGATCVITSSSSRWTPAGTVINYTFNNDGSLTSVITVATGTATGRCDLAPIFADGSPGACVFASGTGSLTQFHLDVAVDTVDFVTWTWDGTYTFGSGR